MKAILPRAVLLLLPALAGYACIGAPAELQTSVVALDARAPRDGGHVAPSGDTGPPPSRIDAGSHVEPVVRGYSSPVVVHLQDSQLKEEELEITEPWFGASNEMYFRSEGFLAQENFNVSCNWPEATCRAGGQLQSVGADGADMIRPCTLGTAAAQPLRGPLLYGNGDTLFLQLPGPGEGRQRPLLKGVTFAYVFPGTSDFSAIEGNNLKLFHYTPGSTSMRPTAVESANWGRFDGSYHAADSASAPSLIVYTDAQGHAAARTRDDMGAWIEAPELVKELFYLLDARMTWMSTDTTRIVFSGKVSPEGRAQMYTATR